MTTAIKGLYRNGVIKPLEKVNIKGEAEVIITFLNETKRRKKDFLSSAGSWRDIDTKKLKKEIYEARRILTRKKVKL